MKHYQTLSELHRGNGWPPPEHPLISIVGCQSACPLGDREFSSDCYMIGFKKLRSGVIRYGRTVYDHTNGSMLFVKPRQVIEMKDLRLEEKGFMILFHEDYLYGHPLHHAIQQYGYFDYEVNEALHLSPAEEATIWELHDKIHGEYYNNPDEYSRGIMLSHLASMLTYAQRFYKRQFINRKLITGKTATRFQAALSVYFREGDLPAGGLPSVNKLAELLFLSPRYMSDLLRQETGKTAIELIHLAVISEAKNLLQTRDLGVSQIAYGLGFEDASYFTRLFNKQTGMTPLAFKKKLLN